MYNSNYGTGYGGMGSYGSTGSYGSSYGMGSTLGGMRNLQNNPQQNNQQPNPQQNQRKKVFEEYFKMMGGMRSMLELGFAGVAFYNFGSKAIQLFKKMMLFLLNTSKSFLGFIAKFIPVDQLKSVLMTTTGSKESLKWQNVMMSIVRIALVTLIAVSYKMRNSIKEEVLSKHEELTKKAEEIEKKKETIAKSMEKYNQGSNL